jgi:hypothetical protein
MRYIDSGRRDPAHALGFWLQEHVYSDQTVHALRWQAGFFDAGSLEYFAPLIRRLRASNAIFHALIGSNDGITRRTDIEALLAMAGPPRSNCRIGIVRFSNAYFHPKTVHIVRGDGSIAAYVGSANLTTNGVTSLHVEAGLLADTREGDDPLVLARIAEAVDWWFAEPRAGLTVVSTAADLDALAKQGVIDVPPPPPGPEPGEAALTHRSPLARLVCIPQPPPAPPPSDVPNRPARWSKRLSRSDAQRKGTGNQRGSITLVQAGYPINAQTYFREQFFKDATWVPERTRTGERRESATVRFSVNFLGEDLGVQWLEVTYAPNREASQANYTSLLHLGSLARYFSTHNVTGKWLRMARSAEGRYSLSIADEDWRSAAD